MKTKEKKTKKTKKVEDNYFASVKILGKTYTSTAPDLRTAIEFLNVGKVAKGVSILKVTHGDKSKDVILPGPQTFRLFSSSGLVREVNMKNLLMRFSGI